MMNTLVLLEFKNVNVGRNSGGSGLGSPRVKYKGKINILVYVFFLSSLSFFLGKSIKLI